MFRASLIFALLILPLSGCTYSVHPLLTEKDLSRDFDLSGDWKMSGIDEEKQTVFFKLEEKRDAAIYHLSVEPEWGSGLEPVTYNLQIGKIGGKHYAQLVRQGIKNSPPLLESIPAHFFCRVELINDELHLHPMNHKECSTLLESQKYPHLVYSPTCVTRYTVLTQSTPQLQKMVVKHSDRLFITRPQIFKRIPNKNQDTI